MSCPAFFTVVFFILTVILGGITLCRIDTCLWNKTFCQVRKVILQSPYLLGDYYYKNDRGYDVILSLVILEESDNTTYLQELKNYTYFEGSYHQCYVYHTDLKIAVKPYSDRHIILMSIFSLLSLLGLIIFSLILCHIIDDQLFNNCVNCWCYPFILFYKYLIGFFNCLCYPFISCFKCLNKCYTSDRIAFITISNKSDVQKIINSDV